MVEYLVTAVLGIVISVLGCINMTGNISSLHSYHRNRVTEENRKPFGRLVGLGTLIIGLSMILFSALLYLYDTTGSSVFTVIGTVELIAGIAVGLGLSFYAMIKYNGGIF